MNPLISLWGIYPRELETYIPTKTCLRMFIGTLSKEPQTGNNQMSIKRRMDKKITRYILAIKYY